MFVKNKKSKPLKTPGKPVKRGTEYNQWDGKGVKKWSGKICWWYCIVQGNQNESWLWRFAGDPYDAKGIIKQQMKLNA